MTTADTPYTAYSSGHPWYYVLGGPILMPSDIRKKVKMKGYAGYLESDIEKAANRSEPQRSQELAEIKKSALASMKRNLSEYRHLVRELREHRQAHPERQKQPICDAIDTSMSLKHNHLYNDFAHLLFLETKTSNQLDLFDA